MLLERINYFKCSWQPVDSFTRAEANFSRHHSSAESLLKASSREQEIVIALGSKVGDRISNVNAALQLMKDSGIRITRNACLYEIAPAYVTDQPLFLNSAVRGATKLGPHELLRQLKQIEKALGRTDGIRFGPRPIDLDIIFYGGELLDFAKRTHVMGILNLIPDSFSDGGEFQEVEAAVNQVKMLLSEGADIIDMGAQSARPFAKRLSVGEELQTLVSVLGAVKNILEIEGKLLSVDSFYADVAAEAVNRGIHLVNDVSGGHLDPKILEVVSDQKLQYEDVCKRVASELYSRVRGAKLAGISLWRLIADPGIGFSKDSEQNFQLFAGLSSIGREMGKRSIGASHVPMLVGPSRKRYAMHCSSKETLGNYFDTEYESKFFFPF